ncbi:uncharacterized protein UTRI_03480 [Ustilago trichophora]|uniref:LrgB-domain-containing protein n=1 Tax=Ustilago trichophora TaxID=86804 RepID=A0A5C3E1C0_9BASI|nr:uncharacterized protein UTRI_03480 [Ustilago trichophora]
MPSSTTSSSSSALSQNNTPTLLVTSPTDVIYSSTNSSQKKSIPPSTIADPASTSTSRTASGSQDAIQHSNPTIIIPSNISTSNTLSDFPLPSNTNNECEACTQDRPYISHIRKPSHILLALRLLLTDPHRRQDLFTNWIHVPLGITALLVLVWAIKQAMDRAPFRFPSPVIAMVLLFALLLLLDWVSTTNFVQSRFSRTSQEQQEQEQRVEEKDGKKFLLQPMLTLLEAPCDFCLRYMSVMFTPSFILIPAREIINGREIGLITGWFAASQLLALIFPVLLHKAIRSAVGAAKTYLGQRSLKREEKSKKAIEQRRASVATLVAVMSTINPPLSGEKVLKGDDKFGSVATGLSGMTAIATAPLTVNATIAPPVAAVGARYERRQDAQRQLEHVQLETARQQGDPYATAHTPLPEHHHHYPTNSPRSPGSGVMHHNHRLHHQNSYFGRGRTAQVEEGKQTESGVGRSRSLARSWIHSSARLRDRAASSLSPSRAGRPRSGGNNNNNNNNNNTEQGSASVDGGFQKSRSKFGAIPSNGGSRLKHLALPPSRRPQSAGSHPSRGDSTEAVNGLSPTFDEYIFQKREELILSRRGSKNGFGEDGVEPRQMDEGETLVMPTLVPPSPTRGSQEKGKGESGYEIDVAPTKGDVVDEKGVRRPSKADSEMTMSQDVEVQHSSTGVDVDVEKCTIKDSGNLSASHPPAEPKDEEKEEEELDAIDRLVKHLWNAIPWFIFTLVFIAGLPLFYLINISLPLFLGVNILTFLCSITLVPPPIRRYAHPILTTSLSTILILWALGAIRGWGLKRTLSSYSVNAKYTVLWSLSGYTGPVIGAGDVLFSTLDAGIVSLAIPMYRYRWDLWLHLTDMLVVLFPCSLLSLFVWPTVAANIGIAPERALAFASRFMSTPLAIELSLTIGADESITVVLVVITGILISIFKDPFFKLFRLDPNQDGPPTTCSIQNQQAEVQQNAQDYLTIGIAMGSTAGAIGASSLIAKPRCMAIASLSFVLFGAILLIFAAIPPIVDTLRRLALAPLVFTPAS